MRPRRRYTAGFKAGVARAAPTERPPLAGLAARCQPAVAQITRWERQPRRQAARLLPKGPFPSPRRLTPGRSARPSAGRGRKTSC